ncbi:autophagy protein Apg6-domain-containing protein [Schizothecium vesticola]|uniref:Autophagy protein Apg6-domain-containing protein n=1 Tax=Schizothecium vesticola TaxID=314040 RepID=A0AA40FAV8_9PEZI|nr:autophagy protein Apg6-domain-containing protein [Schizothecium vesticola]
MHCQKCRTPLKLDSSLGDLNPAAYDVLVATHSQQPPKKPLQTPRPLHSQNLASRSIYDKISRNAAQPTFKRHSGPVPSDGHRDNPAMSFVYLTESQIAGPSTQRSHPLPGPDFQSPSLGQDGAADDDNPTKSHETERINKLFEILTARSDIDHPICVDCSDLLVEEMQKKLDSVTRERDLYVAHLKEHKANAPTAEEIKAQEASLRQAQQAEATARSTLRQLEDEKTALDAELSALSEESAQLDTLEETFWRERNAFTSRLADFQNERDSVNTKFDYDSRQLEKLQRSNVYNDTFSISHDGTFATINGLRLGRLSAKPVDWPEINAAWGHALLLVVTVADRLGSGFRFDGYEPQPLGSTSRIVRVVEAASPASSQAPPPPPKRQVLDLFSSGDMPLGLTFMHRKFDTAMAAFLELVRQLGAHVERQTRADGKALYLPYRIEGDKIDDVSIRLGMAQDDHGWTKACKLTLTCCKFLLAHASNRNAVANGRASVAPQG